MSNISFSQNRVTNVGDYRGHDLNDLSSQPYYTDNDVIYKHCRPEHLPESGRSFRIGTLSDFRTIQDRYVRDDDEGKFHLNLRFPEGTKLSRRFLNDITLSTMPGLFIKGAFSTSDNSGSALFQGERVVGQVHGHSDQLKITDTKAGSLIVGGDFVLSLESADAFVFCLSQNSSKGSEIFGNEYTARWEICANRIHEFVHLIEQRVFEAVLGGQGITSDFIGVHDEPAFRPPGDLGKLEPMIFSTVRSIRYAPKKYQIATEDPGHLVHVRESFNDSDATKDPRFADEKELRIIMRVFYTDRKRLYMMPNRLKPFLLSCDDALHVIDEGKFVIEGL